MQAPFSTEFNIALWSAWKVDCVVTKESGETGGFSFKAEAAAKLSIPFIVIKRPQLSYPVVTSDFNSVAKLLEQSLSQRKNSREADFAPSPPLATSAEDAKPQSESEESKHYSPESNL